MKCLYSKHIFGRLLNETDRTRFFFFFVLFFKYSRLGYRLAFFLQLKTNTMWSKINKMLLVYKKGHQRQINTFQWNGKYCHIFLGSQIILKNGLFFKGLCLGQYVFLFLLDAYVVDFFFCWVYLITKSGLGRKKKWIWLTLYVLPLDLSVFCFWTSWRPVKKKIFKN